MRICPIPVALLVALAGPSARAEAPPLQAVHARALRDVAFERTATRIERGNYLATAAIGCILCHSERDTALPGAPPRAGREFGGAILDESEGYRLVAPNLTPDIETGAGAWSDDMLARAIREGVGHDGRGIGGQMWWWAFRLLSDEDVASVVVFLRSLPPVRNPLPARMLSPEQERSRAEQARPLEAPVPPRDLTATVERGRYLIEVADCAGCHSAWEAPTNPGMFGGGNGIERSGHTAFSANLSPDPSGLGGWSEEIFRGAMRNGRGGRLDPIMPWAAYRQMTDEDLRAIYAALRTVPPVRHWVNNVDPPTHCAVCGQEHGLGAMNGLPTLERVPVDLGRLESYTGTYRLAGDVVEIVVTTSDGKLFASEGGPAIELVPVAGGRLRGIGLSSPVSFERDDSGQVVVLLTYEIGTSRWERVR